MTFDAPLLLLARPGAGAGARLRRLAGPAADGSGWRGGGRPRSGGSARARGGWAPVVLGLVGLLGVPWRSRGRAGAGPRSDRDPGAEPGLRGGHQPLDAGRGRRAQPAAARRPRGPAADPGPRGRPARPHRVRRAGATSWRRSRWTAARSGCTSTRSIRTWRAKAAPTSRACWPRAAQLLGATTDAADRVLVVFTDGEAHDTLPEIVAPGRGAEGGRRPPHHGGRGRRRRPTRIPIRDSAGTLVEYKRDEDGTVIQTQRRDDILRAVGGCGRGHAGAERGAATRPARCATSWPR